jgi:hypothetical protein
MSVTSRLAAIAVGAVALVPSAALAHPGVHAFAETGSNALAGLLLAAFALQLAGPAVKRARRLGSAPSRGLARSPRALPGERLRLSTTFVFPAKLAPDHLRLARVEIAGSA